MSFEQQGIIHQELVLGNTLPNAEPQQSSHALFISLSELIAESVFYHPALAAGGVELLPELEQNSLKSLLNGLSIEEHFVSVLVERITQSINAEHRSIRICLSSSDSYAFKALIGGSIEEDEVNPAMGVRGVSRFASSKYSPAFALECKVIKALQEKGHNVEIVVPFVRALSDAATIIDRLAEQGLPRGLNGLKVLYVCSVPSAALVAEKLLQYFDGVVIDWDDLTQITLAVDKYNEAISYLYNPESEAVSQLVNLAVTAANAAKKPVVVVTRGLENYPKLQEHLAENVQPESIFNF
ncbi:putative PEP-binding protein [Vibrio plantisponsor]|uniref:PEP-binding protein n=1 Tax=Vibrio plantisponsor TaxID=664643 RepID=A0ABU4IEF0_9VIBR|nr:putative PEP-binding protein [Vibrio plantisponsor]MDW6016946.1 putative PEP-binding protein [Vibrio plantisponsor]NNM40713.1 phosphoenolpyruvate synthase [Vibrio plantisponsor]